MCWTPATVNRIHNAVTDEQTFGLILAHKIGVNLTGLLNGLAYGCSSVLQKELRGTMYGKGDSDSDDEDSSSDSGDDADVAVGLENSSQANQRALSVRKPPWQRTAAGSCIPSSPHC